MEEDKYINLYLETYKQHRPKPVELIKNMLINYKEKHINLTKAINEIKSHFSELENNDITNSSELNHLFDIYWNARPGYDNGYHLLAIKNELQSAFKKIENPPITFSEYIKCLAKRECTSEIGRNFNNYNDTYSAMYKIGKFEGFKNLRFFDIVTPFDKKYDQIKSEIYRLAYPSNNNPPPKKKKPKKRKSVKITLPIDVEEKFLKVFKSEKVYSILEGYYFNDTETTYKDYLNVFFENPKNHKSKIVLDCKTQEFAFFLKRFKDEFAPKSTFSAIGKNGFFITKSKGKILSRDNLSNSAKKASSKDKNLAEESIEKIKTVK